MQLNAYLEIESNEHVEGMITQIEDKVAFIDIVHQAIRKRIGFSIAILDIIPKYAPSLVILDADTMRWCRDSYEGSLDQKDIILIAEGKKSAIHFDIQGTRHLLLKLQALLLSVVVPMRDVKWFERKQTCDNLLALLSGLANVVGNSRNNRRQV